MVQDLLSGWKGVRGIFVHLEKTTILKKSQKKLYREFLMSVRRGEKELSAYVEYGKQLISEIEADEPRSKLLAATDEEWLNDWLLTVRRSGLREVNLARNRSDSLLTNFENFG